MHPSHDFMQDLATVLCVAAVTTVVFQRLRQPVVLGYVLAGFLVGPHFPLLPLMANADNLNTLSELGVTLLMFSLGLEFSVRRLLKMGPIIGVITLIEVAAMIWAGFAAGRALGFTIRESIFTGAICSISSTMIIARVFAERKIEPRLSELVFGILIFEDLAAILLLTLLPPMARGLSLDAGNVLGILGRLVGFLAVVLVAGLLVIPRFMRAVVKLRRPETTLVASVGICFAFAILARSMDYSVALGAFLGGSLVSESGVSHQVEALVRPLRDVFSAIFFVSVGMLIDPHVMAQHWRAAAVLSLVVIFGKLAAVTLGALLTGHPLRTSIKAGMSLTQIGEFSFIIAGLGLSLRVTGAQLFPIAVATSVLTTFTTPWLIRASEPVARWLDGAMPRPLQTFLTLHGTWVQQLSERATDNSLLARARARVRWLFVDGAILVGLVIGSTRTFRPVVMRAMELTGLPAGVVRSAVAGFAIALALPCLWGMVATTRRLAEMLAQAAFPIGGGGRLDLAQAPRRALVSALQLMLLLVVALPILAITQPFLPPFRGAMALFLPLVVVGFLFWRSATSLHGHVRAGAEVIVEVLEKQGHSAPPGEVEEAEQMLPGLGHVHTVRLEPASAGTGRSLAQLNLRVRTGANVVGIVRGDEGIVTPSPQDPLRAGDVIALMGTDDAVKEAAALLSGPFAHDEDITGEQPVPAREP